MSNPIHATNAWNPTGRNLLPVEGTRLFYAHADTLNGARTFVLLGSQRHLTFVADLEGHVEPASLRSVMLERFGLYPHLVDVDPRPGLPRPFEDQVASPRAPASPEAASSSGAASSAGVASSAVPGSTDGPASSARGTAARVAAASPDVRSVTSSRNVAKRARTTAR